MIDKIAWSGLLQNIADGECTPFIGPEACFRSLPGVANTAYDWAQQFDYPLDDAHDLARVAQFLAVRHSPMAPKEMLHAAYKGFPPLELGASDEPHGILADFPLPIYITTNYDDCM